MSRPPHASLPRHPLYKNHSWSPETTWEEAWQRQRDDFIAGSRSNSSPCLSRSLSIHDLEELKACYELGFGFDSPDIDPKLLDILPALEFFQAADKQYNRKLPRSSSSSTTSTASDCDSGTSVTLFDSGDDPDVKKMKLKQWAKVVAWVAREQSPTSASTADSTD